MKILDLGLKTIMAEQRENFLDSLLAEGIDVEKGQWDHATVAYNAKVCADILSVYARQEGLQFLRIILEGLRSGEYLSTMAYVYIMAECNRWLPPYAIIQHAVDEKLLEEYCKCLQVLLPIYYRSGVEERLILIPNKKCKARRNIV